MALFAEQTVLTSAARTATFASPSFPCEGRSLEVGLNVTAVSGTSPTLAVEVQWSHDNVNFGSAETATSFASITAAKVTNAQFTAAAPFYRLNCVIGGTTPSFTFTASATSF